ncbi:MAG: cold shock domain-containing protein [candidate division Zixibacteria bacterium]|nr:cold shock domain-containing protein [candidate division Zixibacteria bacterium]MCI0596735.1 cold shock domain-containing protein [candidate division Zixibacteria bacterium]
MAKGRVKWFNETRGYGFITNQEGEELYVHFTDIQGRGYKTLVEGEEVEYEIKANEKGKQATNVMKL